MNKLLCVKIDLEQAALIADVLSLKHTEILHKWKMQPRFQRVMKTKEIDIDFFIKHFGARVLNNFISVLRNEKVPGQCPVIISMIRYFTKQRLLLDDIYQVCSAKRNMVLNALLESGLSHSEELYEAVVDIFDANFSGVIREYMKIVQEKLDNKEEIKLYLTSGIVAEDSKNVVINSEKEPENAVVKSDEENNGFINEYFSVDVDEGDENVIFRTDDADELIECFDDVSDKLSLAVIHKDDDELIKVAMVFSMASSILLHYTPYLDSLSASLSELSVAMIENKESFSELLINNSDEVLKLFDAVSADMSRYVERFSIENIAMKNSHHIHEPTTLSIRQIISMFVVDDTEEGDMEFF
jgi:hypothetical protein